MNYNRNLPQKSSLFLTIQILPLPLFAPSPTIVQTHVGTLTATAILYIYNGPFWQFMAFMNTINMTLDIIMLGIPGLSMENVAHQ